MVENQFRRDLLRIDTYQSHSNFCGIGFTVGVSSHSNFVFQSFEDRYGLPVNFAAILLHPLRKSSKRLRDTLDRLFGYLDQSIKPRHDEVKSHLSPSNPFFSL